MNKIRVFVADDHLIMREGILSLLKEVPDIKMVGEAADGVEAVARVEQLVPDVVLMDIAMPGLNGLEATRQIKEKSPQVKVLVLTMYDTDQYVSQMLQSGASGYVVKTAATRELVSAIRAVHRGDVYLHPTVARALVDDYLQKVKEEEASYDELTRRENEILRLVAEGKKNKEIAKLLGISLRTVQAHRANMMDKLRLHDRTELVKYAIRKGMLDP